MNEDLLEQTGTSMTAMGGTEMMMRRIFDRVPRDVMAQCQIIPTRLTVDLDPALIRVAWIHDLETDPAVAYLANKGWAKFHKIVFVSNWQQERFVQRFDIPYSKCIVIPNGIVPIQASEKPTDGIRLIYTPTPHRGLGILSKVFQKLCETNDDITLDVFSNMDLYDRGADNASFEPLYLELQANPKITYHGTKSNDEVREALIQADIFAYPSIWMETSCLCLIEAMSAGCLAVHPTLGALPETSAGLTAIYPFHQDVQKHAQLFYGVLSQAIEKVRASKANAAKMTQFAQLYANHTFNIARSAHIWEHLLLDLHNEPRGFQSPGWTYSTDTSRLR